MNVYVCSECSASSAFPTPRCPYCLAPGSHVLRTVSDMVVPPGRPPGRPPVPLSIVGKYLTERWSSGLSGFDAVLGGGLVPRSLVVLGGEPGSGKSTLALQAAMTWAMCRPVLYVTGEETLAALAVRADRMGVPPRELYAWESTAAGMFLEWAAHVGASVLILDSFHTLFVESDAEGLSLVLAPLRLYAKHAQAAIVLIAHVTKEGEIRGPKTLEHLVDAVFYLEGDRAGSERELVVWKNRHGAAGARALLKMTAWGLRDRKPIEERGDAI